MSLVNFRRNPPQLSNFSSVSTMLSRLPISQVAIKARQQVSYHAYSLWLFTLSDIKTVVVPSLAFAFLTALAQPTPMTLQFALHLTQRIPAVLFWTWINLLAFALGNQRQPEAVAEDALNKPWRPLPAKRMRPDQARMILVAAYPLATFASLLVGGTRQCLALMALGIWYNDFKGADYHYMTRNFISASGVVLFSAGALEVLLDRNSLPLPGLFQWYLVIGTAIFTTMHLSDMYDQAGDSLRGRRTVPLVFGDGPARWSIALAMSFWGFFCPWAWQASLDGYLLCIGLGGVITIRCLALRTVASDKKTFLLWNVWLVALYGLPLLRSATV